MSPVRKSDRDEHKAAFEKSAGIDHHELFPQSEDGAREQARAWLQAMSGVSIILFIMVTVIACAVAALGG